MSEFRSFATLLREKVAPAVTLAAAPEPPPSAATPSPPPPRPSAPDPQVAAVMKGFVAELRRLRARAADLFEMESETLLATLGADVLARELLLAPADISALVKRAKARLGTAAMTVRLAPDDCAYFGETLGAEPDAGLERGDIIVETAHGSIDMRLGSRLKASLAERSVDV